MAEMTRGERGSQMPGKTRDYFPAFFPDVEDVFGDFLRGWGLPRMGLGPFNRMAHTFVPSMDVRDTDKELVITAELPGMDQKDVDVSLDQNVLTISGEKKQEQETNERQRYAFERRYGSFSRSVALPEGLNTDGADACFKNGVLTVKIPKTEQFQRAAKKLNVRSEDGQSNQPTT